MKNFPKIMIWVYVFVSVVFLRLVNRETLLPFDQWKIFTVLPNTTRIYLVYASDLENHSECLLQRCKNLLPPLKALYMYNWTQRLGAAIESSDLNTVTVYKNLISTAARRNKNVTLALYTSDINLVNFAKDKNVPAKVKLFEF